MPDIHRLILHKDFQESLVGFKFSDNLIRIDLYNYKHSLVGVEFPKKLLILELIMHYA